MESRRGSGSYICEDAGILLGNTERRADHEEKRIVVMLTYIDTYIFPIIVREIEKKVTQAGGILQIAMTDNSVAKERMHLEEFLRTRRIDGLIAEPVKSGLPNPNLDLYQKLQKSGIPVLFVNSFYENLTIPHVSLDDEKAGYIATKHLLECGHTRIAGIFKADDIQGQNRHRGYVQALQEAGMLYDPDKVIWFHTEDRKVHPREGILRLLAKGISLDAVVCYNDQIAMQIIPALASRGIRVPEDISVTGYDNSCMAMGDGFHLTTIVHPQEKLGEMAAQLLLSLLRGETLQPEQSKILIQPELVVGNSCCGIFTSKYTTC